MTLYGNNSRRILGERKVPDGSIWHLWPFLPTSKSKNLWGNYEPSLVWTNPGWWIFGNVKIRCLFPEPFLPKNQVQTNTGKMCNLYLRIFCQKDFHADHMAHMGWMPLSFYPHMLFTITYRILDCFINIKWKKSIFYSALNIESKIFIARLFYFPRDFWYISRKSLLYFI